MVSAFLSEVLTEGEALRGLIRHYATEGDPVIGAVGRLFRSDRYDRVAFAGMGSSYCAPFAVLDHLNANGVPAIAPNAYELSKYCGVLVTPSTLVVAISKSGTTTEILNLIRDMGRHPGLIGLVNQPESTLAHQCKIVLPMKAGSETEIASKSFLCTLAVLNLVAMELTGASARNELTLYRDIAEWIFAYLAGLAQNNPPLLDTIDVCTHVDVLARGASFSTAYKSALVLREVPRVMAAAIDVADYAHGWAKTVQSGYVGIVLAPEFGETSIEARAAKQILDRGGKVILVTSSAVESRSGLTVARHPSLPERLAPLAQVAVCDAMIGAMASSRPS